MLFKQADFLSSPIYYNVLGRRTSYWMDYWDMLAAIYLEVQYASAEGVI